MAELTIHRGTHQIGGCCTELTCGGVTVHPPPTATTTGFIRRCPRTCRCISPPWRRKF